VGIWVLQATAMPSILVETGFISNPEDEDYLNSVNGQQQICDAITAAVQHYKTALETNTFQTIPADSQ
jgi:N-acetylmuramoyl-L-alanine amidase